MARSPRASLTPRHAEQALRENLVDAPAELLVAWVEHTFGEASEEWLRYVGHDRDRRPSSVRDYSVGRLADAHDARLEPPPALDDL
jgi:hypothetical protein